MSVLKLSESFEVLSLLRKFPTKGASLDHIRTILAAIRICLLFKITWFCTVVRIDGSETKDDQWDKIEI